MSVVNAGTGPALYIKQSGNTPIAYFLDADGTGDIIFENNGFVGLGTASPNNRLTVVGVISSTNIVYASGGNSDLWNSTYTSVNANSANGATTYTTTNANSASWSSVYSTVCATSANYILDGGNTKGANILIGTNDNFNLNLETGGTTKMTVTSSGFVGIGVTTPSTSLHIYSGSSEFARFQRGTPSGTGSIGIYQQDSNRLILGYNSDVGGGQATGGIASAGVIRGDAGLHLISGSLALGGITVTTSGNVGIGTITPNEKLTVVGVISSTNIVYASGGNSNLWNSTYTTVNTNSANWSSLYSTVCAASANYILDGGNTKSNNITIGTNDNFNLNLETANATRMTVTSAGNVGIGTTTPSAKLQVAGNIAVPSGNIFGVTNLDTVTDTTQSYLFGLCRSDVSTFSRFNGMKVYNIANAVPYAASRIGFYTDNTGYTASTEHMTVSELGNIGIGITTPTQKLDVVGNIKASGTLTVSGGNSDQWNSVYSNINASSARRDSVYTTTNTNSANWSNAYTSVNANSANGASVYTTTNANSANWSNAYTNVNTNSANWNTTYNTVQTNQSNWTFAYNQVNSGYLNWNSTYTNVNTNSARWNSTYTTVNTNSANWSNAYTTVNSISANGSSTYTTVNTNSANWNSTYTTVCAASANWNSVYSNYNSESPTFVIGVEQGTGQGDVLVKTKGDPTGEDFSLTNLGIFGSPKFASLTVSGIISSSGVMYASGGNSNLWNQNTSALYQATSGQFAVKNANNFFSTSQSLTGDLTVKGIIRVDPGGDNPLQEVATKNFSIAMAIALS